MKKLLIIEDDDESYYLLNSLLIDLGFDSSGITRCSHIEGVLHLETDGFDIVLADLGLPDSPGSETYCKVHAKFPYTPIIVLTGTAEIETALDTIKQGAQDYLVKGEFNRHVLERAINYAIERKRSSNDYQRLFLDNPAPMYIYEDGSFRFLAVNNAALHKYGYSREEFLNLSATDIRPSEDIDTFRATNKAIPGDYCDYGLWRHIDKTGKLFFVHIYAHRSVFEGKVAAVILALDVDKQVKAQAELAEKNKTIENILESITDGFYTINTNWEITYFNKEAERMLGRRREDVLHKNIWESFPGGLKGKFYEQFRLAAREQVSVHFEEYYEERDIWGALSVYPSPDGIAVYFIDITERKKIQEKLFIDEQNLRAIINNTRDIIWSIDREMNIISANQAFWDRVALIAGKPVNQINKEDFDHLRYNSWKEYFDRAFLGESFNTTWIEHTQNGTVYEDISFNPILDKDGSTIGVSCFSRDITQQRIHIDMIEKQNQQLKDIAWIQSHEVRAPVATILGLVELLNVEDPNDPINAALFRNVKTAATELDNVVRKITTRTIM